jgi:hypothetical protein
MTSLLGDGVQRVEPCVSVVGTYTGAFISASISSVLWYSSSFPVIVKSPQCIRRSADGSGDLKGAIGCGASSLVLKGALCVSLMMSTLVFTIDGILANGSI